MNPNITPILESAAKDNSSAAVKNAIKSIVSELVPASKNPEFSMEKWAEFYLPETRKIVLAALKARNNNNKPVTLAVWNGPQGTGKGTNIDALALTAEIMREAGLNNQSASFSYFIDSFAGKNSSIAVGTGGIFNNPQNEYTELFTDLKTVTQETASKGDLIGDMLVNLLVELMITLRISEGSEKITLDVWPRTIAQLAEYDMLSSFLRENNSLINEEIVNLRLLTEQEMKVVLADPEKSAEMTQAIGEYKKSQLEKPEIQAIIAEQKQRNFETDYKDMYEKLQKVVEQVIEAVKNEFSYSKNELATALINESDRSFERMAFRFKKALEKGELPRSDELPTSQLTRQVFYERFTAPAILRAAKNHKVIFATSFLTPTQVINSLIERFLEIHGYENESKNEGWIKIKKIAGEIAEKLVQREEIKKQEYIAELTQ